MTKKNHSQPRKANTVRSKKGRASSGYKGVYKKRDKWQVKINIDGKDVNIGVFDNKEIAAKHFDYHMIKNYGKEKIYLNFPDFDYSNFAPIQQISNKKLNFRKARLIRCRHKKGESAKSLAEEFGVSLTNIYKIIHEIYYPEKDTAEVRVIYNPK